MSLQYFGMEMPVTCDKCGTEVTLEASITIEDLKAQHGMAFYDGLLEDLEMMGWERDFINDDEFICSDCVKEREE